MRQSTNNQIKQMKLNTMKLKVLRSDEVGNKTNGTCHQDTIQTSYFNLINLFGLPTFGKGDKTLCEWVIQNNLGDVVTIYDWKSHTNDPEFVTEWNLGCNGDTYSNVFLDQVMDFIKKGVDADNLVC